TAAAAAAWAALAWEPRETRPALIRARAAAAPVGARTPAGTPGRDEPESYRTNSQPPVHPLAEPAPQRRHAAPSRRRSRRWRSVDHTKRRTPAPPRPGNHIPGSS